MPVNRVHRSYVTLVRRRRPLMHRYAHRSLVLACAALTLQACSPSPMATAARSATTAVGLAGGATSTTTTEDARVAAPTSAATSAPSAPRVAPGGGNISGGA